MKAASLGWLGKTREAAKAGKDLLECKPDFSNRGLALIKHYIKFGHIVERVILGLRKAGVDVA